VKEEKEGQQMKAMSVLDAKEWAIETFGKVELGDPRRSDRAVQVAAAMAENPAASLPTQMGDQSALQAAHRLFINEAISFEQLQDPHWQQTRGQARERKQTACRIRVGARAESNRTEVADTILRILSDRCFVRNVEFESCCRHVFFLLNLSCRNDEIVNDDLRCPGSGSEIVCGLADGQHGIFIRRRIRRGVRRSRPRKGLEAFVRRNRDQENIVVRERIRGATNRKRNCAASIIRMPMGWSP